MHLTARGDRPESRSSGAFVASKGTGKSPSRATLGPNGQVCGWPLNNAGVGGAKPLRSKKSKDDFKLPQDLIPIAYC